MREALEDLPRREHFRPRSGELNRKRQVVEAAAELVDRLVRRQSGARAEEIDRLGVRERRHRVLHLAPHTKVLAAGRQQPQVRARFDQRRQLRRGVDYLLEVVQQQQQLPFPDVLMEPLPRPERLRDRRKHQVGVAQPRQLDPEDAGLEVGHQLPGHLDREPRLARAARTGQRDQARPALEQRGQLLDLAFAPDERAGRARQVRVGDRLQRREGLRPELEKPNRLVEVLEPVLAQIEYLRVHAVAGRRGEEHLPAVSCSRHPGAEMHVQAHVALLAQGRLTHVNAHPSPDRPVLERTLGLHSRGERGLAVLKDNEERVALRVDLDTAVALEGRAQQATMFRQRVPVAVAELLEQARGALDVREEEGDGSGRELARRQAGRR